MAKAQQYNRPHGKKNVMLITVDQWAGSLFGYQGRTDIQTPTIDALAAVGTSFDNTYSTTPVCIPARRELMTGTFSRTHGDRVFNEYLEMPCDIPTIAQTFRDNGYQAMAVGKLHVYPQRARIGFDDVILNEEARRVNYPLEMREDDYSRFINRAGYTGLDTAHGMSNNNYLVRPWHLDESLHQTAWTSRQMCEQIIRRDPSRPAFWYCGFTAPHPPIVPPQSFLNMYQDVEPETPRIGDWAKDDEKLPYCLKYYKDLFHMDTPKYLRDALRGFFASCTQVDFAIRNIIGTLREEGVLKDTILVFTCDHGDMLGTHGMFCKNVFYEESAHVPLIIVPAEGDERVPVNHRDNRLTTLADIMPTLLSMCDLPIPSTVEGMDLTAPQNRRSYIYGNLWEDNRATRMIRTEDFKLIYYTVGNLYQLFDMKNDRQELHDLSGDPQYADVLVELKALLMQNLYGSDLNLVKNGELVGKPDIPFVSGTRDCGVLVPREFLLQRGIR